MNRSGYNQKNGNKVELKQNSISHEKKDKHTQLISDGHDDEMEIIGYKKSQTKNLIVVFGYFLTLGALRLIFHWYPHLRLIYTNIKCPLKDAQNVLIIHRYQQKYKTYFVKSIKTLTCDNSLNSTNVITSDKNSLSYVDSLLNYTLEDGEQRESSKIRAFWVKKLCYVWDYRTLKFLRLIGLDKGIHNHDFHEFKGLSEKEQNLRRSIYGINEIQVPVQSIITLLVLEALNPFYIFQVFTLAVWLAEFYYYYAIAIVLMSVFGIGSSIIQSRRNQLNLKKTVEVMEKVKISRGANLFEEVSSGYLVPGDIILIPAHGYIMQCDAVLLEGNCIVNESLLTGESVPVTKTPIPNTDLLYDLKTDSNHTLFCGTKVIQTRYYGNKSVRAVVIRTGYLTAKGELVRSILYPPPADFKFDTDSYKFLGILACISFIGLLYTVILKGTKGINAGDIAIKALDIITIVIPPALPAAMTVGKLYAINRLRKKKIFCINSRVINVTGSINCVCFDKTGTLTEDGLDMWGVVPVKENTFLSPLNDVKKLPNDSLLLLGMATCHSLTLIDSKLFGDPLDVKMFESTGWLLEEPGVKDTSKYDLLVPTIVKKNHQSDTNEVPEEMGIIKQYQFSSTLQRMSVITRSLASESIDIFCKGSPEMIISLSKPETVPEDIMSILQNYTSMGYRVIALSHRTIPQIPYVKLLKLPRESLETDLNFTGLVILENQLKPQTSPVIEELCQADIKCVMVTGDNIHTALSVARECGIIKGKVLEVESGDLGIYFKENGTTYINSIKMNKFCPSEKDIESASSSNDFHLAVTGKTWTVLRQDYPELIPKIVTAGSVFARMSGEQKQQLILELQNLGYYVAMCGDGANDCGALKAAHTGISLSEAESSVASPFTTSEPNIRCVPTVIREGRAALTTSFGVFKFMIASALTEFTSVIILYGINTNLTDFQFLFIDICLVVNFVSFFGRTEAYKGPIFKDPPSNSLLGLTPLVSLALFMISAMIFQYTGFKLIYNFPWFENFIFDENNTIKYVSYENFATFSVSLFQYIGMAIIFSKGKPYRLPIFSNVPLFTSLIIMFLICCYIISSPAFWVAKILELRVPPTLDAKLILIFLGVLNILVALFFEKIIVDILVDKKIKSFFQRSNSKKNYLKLKKDIKLENFENFNKKMENINLGFVDEKDYTTRL